MKYRFWAIKAACFNFAAMLLGCQSTQGQSPLVMTMPPGTIGKKPMGNPVARAQAPDAPVPGGNLRIPSANASESPVIRTSYYEGAPVALAANSSAGSAKSDKPSGGNLLRDLFNSTAKLGSQWGASTLPTTVVAANGAKANPSENQGALKTALVVQTNNLQPIPVSPGNGLSAEPALLVNRAMAAYQKMDGVIVRFARRERINGSEHPEETILLALRRDSFAVHMKWLGTNSPGREVVFNPKLDEKRMTVVTAPGDIPFMSGGKRMAMDINSTLVRGSTRYSITDTGFLSMINRLATSVEAFNRGAYSGGSVTALGAIRRPEFPGEVDAVEVKIPAGAEREFPGGGKRLMCFSKENNLPCLLITWDEKGQEMEYMKYDRFQLLHLDDEDFDPDFLFPAPGKAKSSASK